MRAAVAIPSIAPVVVKVEGAVLVVFTEVSFTQASGPHGLPPGHPPLPRAPDGAPGPLEGGPFHGSPDDESFQRGQGAGFIITTSGYALTNHHVVENAKSITVHVGEGREEVKATLVGSDAKTDVALIKLEGPSPGGKGWPVIPLGDSASMKVGDFVIAIGSPFGLEQSVSLGIISGRSRRDIAPSGREGLYDFMQTDASINPGNSGGPLLNLYGEAIGMNAAVNAAGSGIGFAIPINMVKTLLPSLKETGRFARSWIGVQITSVGKDVTQGLGLERPRGALVREVVEDGPAAKGGIQTGDVIVTFEGKAIEDSLQLPLLAGEVGVDKGVTVEVVRDGKAKTFTFKLGAHPDNTAVAVPAPPPEPKSTEAKKPEDGSLGVVVVTLDSDDRDRLHLRAEVAGTRVAKVRPGSPAFFAGLRADDVIIEVNHKDTRSAADFAALVQETPAGGLLKIRLRRGASLIFIPLPKP